MYPNPIQHHLTGYTTSGENHRTSSQSEIYLYQKPGAPDLFLKINTGQTDAPLILEKEAMNWLHTKLPVPQVLAYAEENDKTYLLTTRITGTPASALPSEKNDIVQMLASALQNIHTTPTTHCPLPQYTAQNLLQQAHTNIQSGIVTTQSLQQRGDNRTPQEAYTQVQALYPKRESLVFTHGDYCLPNILIHNHTLSGIIDWGSAGIGDRHRDLVSAQYSIRRNLGEEWLAPFFDHYGRKQIDEQTLAFYTAIYELT